MHPIHIILVPYDFTEQAEAALDLAVTLGEPLEADLHLGFVVHPPSYLYGGDFLTVSTLQLPDLRADYTRRLQAVADNLRSSVGSDEVHVLEGTRVADSLAGLAESLHADLITMGTHGRTGLAPMLHGSVAERMLRRAPCPVVTVPAHRTGWQAAAHVAAQMASRSS